MVVNNGGNLSVEYFIAYWGKFTSTTDSDHDLPVEDMLEKFFEGNPDHFGSLSYQSFTQAIDEITVN